MFLFDRQVGAVIVYTPECGVSLDLLRTDVQFLRKRYELDEQGKSEGRLIIRFVLPWPNPKVKIGWSWLIFLLIFLTTCVFRNEKSSSVYTTELLTNILKEEGAELFDARSASLGHTLQGGTPSPLDRARAVRLANKCMQFLETHHNARHIPGGDQPLAHQKHHPRASGSHGVPAPPQRRATLVDDPSTGEKVRYRKESAAIITIQSSKILFAPVADVVKETDMKNRRGKNVWWKDIRSLVELMGGRTGSYSLSCERETCSTWSWQLLLLFLAGIAEGLHDKDMPHKY
jgi:6-phosphofructokinase 1